MPTLYLNYADRQDQLDGTIDQAQSMAADYFNLPAASEIEESFLPGDHYIARVYSIDRDDKGHRRESLIFRVSTRGFKPVIPTKTAALCGQ